MGLFAVVCLVASSYVFVRNRQVQEADQIRELEAEIAAHAAREPKEEVAYAVKEGEPHNVRIHERGDHENLGVEVPRNYLAVLGGGVLGDEKRSGRLALAGKIASADNPLTARVMV